MAASIFFTESKDFKLIKERILSQQEEYLVYVYADTTNIRIPRDLITELPKYGNNLIWVDTAQMDASDISHHIVLTIGQLMDPEEEIDFFVVSRSSKQEKTIRFLRNQGIPAELIGSGEKTPTARKAGTGRRGRPKKSESGEEGVVKTGRRGRPKKEKPVAEGTEEVVKTGKRGRPRKVKAEVMAETAKAPAKKRGRPKAAPVESTEGSVSEAATGAEKVSKKKTRKPAAKKTRKSATPRSRKPRVEKEITEEMINEKIASYEVNDTNLSLVLNHLFAMKKVSRPKFAAKLLDMVKNVTLEGDTEAEAIVNRLGEMGIVTESEPGGRLSYKD